MAEISELSVTYNDVVVTYNEQTNFWLFTVRGRERHTESLAKAKEVIDSVPKEKRAGFQPFAAWQVSEYGDPVLVKVTSVAHKGRYDRPSFRVVKEGKAGTRHVDAADLVADTPENRAVIDKILAARAKIKDIAKESHLLAKKLPRVKIPEEALEDDRCAS